MLAICNTLFDTLYGWNLCEFYCDSCFSFTRSHFQIDRKLKKYFLRKGKQIFIKYTILILHARASY